MQKLAASFFILVASISYGSLGIVAKFAYGEGVAPTMLTLFQMLAGLLFFALLKPMRISGFFRLPFRSMLLLSIGGLMSALTAYFYYDSLRLLPASVAIIMLFQFVWIGLVFELLHKKRRPTKAEIASILLCYAGTYMSVGGDIAGIRYDITGLLLGFISGATFAAYIFLSSTVCLEEKSDTRAFWIIFSAFASISALTIGDLKIENIEIAVKWGALCGVLGVLLPFYIYAVYSPKIGAGATSLIGSAELPSALILSALILGEELSVLQIAGSILVIFAVFIVFISESKAK